MNPTKVTRERLNQLTDLPNIGQSIAKHLVLLGINQPNDLTGKCPYALFDEFCAITAKKQDLCLLDVFISVVRFMDGEPPKPWWHYTAERKRTL